MSLLYSSSRVTNLCRAWRGCGLGLAQKQLTTHALELLIDGQLTFLHVHRRPLSPSTSPLRSPSTNTGTNAV